ncbi:MAG: hypothetical protein AAF479_13405, partial [Pseudomonadota bacterium]
MKWSILSPFVPPADDSPGFSAICHVFRSEQDSIPGQQLLSLVLLVEWSAISGKWYRNYYWWGKKALNGVKWLCIKLSRTSGGSIKKTEQVHTGSPDVPDETH